MALLDASRVHCINDGFSSLLLLHLILLCDHLQLGLLCQILNIPRYRFSVVTGPVASHECHIPRPTVWHARHNTTHVTVARDQTSAGVITIVKTQVSSSSTTNTTFIHNRLY
jgi:hypothetical protein